MVISVLGDAVLPPIPAAVASFLGLFFSGLLAGKLASGAPMYQGALVGAGYVICEALGVVPSGAYFADPLSDTVALIASDALVIVVAALGGLFARLWSSSDTGTGH